MSRTRRITAAFKRNERAVLIRMMARRFMREPGFVVPGDWMAAWPREIARGWRLAVNPAFVEEERRRILRNGLKPHVLYVPERRDA